MEKEVLLQAKDIVVSFPLKKDFVLQKRKYFEAVSGVSLEIMRGETFGLVGESGCGKTTFANATLGFQSVKSGEIIFDGQSLTHTDKKSLRLARLRMQKVFQDPASSLNPRFTVFDAIGEPLKIKGDVSREEIHERVSEMARSVGFDENELLRYTSEFSGGQQQRIAIARALILNPDYIVCDEPVSSLDVSLHNQIINLLLELQKKTNVSYLFISHNLAVVKKICPRIAIMYFGKVVEYGESVKIFNNPVHPYTKTLMSAILPMGYDENEKNVLQNIKPTKVDKKYTDGELCEVEKNHYAILV